MIRIDVFKNINLMFPVLSSEDATQRVIDAVNNTLNPRWFELLVSAMQITYHGKIPFKVLCSHHIQDYFIRFELKDILYDNKKPA